jgi:hypothetical protein
MKSALAFGVLVCVAVNCDAPTGRAEDLKTENFIKIDAPKFKDALHRWAPRAAEKIEAVDAYGIFIDGNYAGQIGDTIRVSKQVPDFKIVGRMDGKAWSSAAAGKPTDRNLIGLYEFQPEQSKNLSCVAASSCEDFDVEHKEDQTKLLSFKEDAFTGKQFTVNLAAFGGGPIPPSPTDTKSIDVRTDPIGAEIYLDNAQYWQRTNSLLLIPFKKERGVYLSHHIALRLASQSKSSGDVEIRFDNSFVSYTFKTGTLEVK